MREPHLLSGGQKQRTALAGVLAVPRRVLVLDEPTAMLDPAGRAEVLEAVRGLRAEGLAIVYVTQEMDEVVGADRVVALERGLVVYEGDVPGLFGEAELRPAARSGAARGRRSGARARRARARAGAAAALHGRAHRGPRRDEVSARAQDAARRRRGMALAC